MITDIFRENIRLCASMAHSLFMCSLFGSDCMVIMRFWGQIGLEMALVVPFY